jgi:hypothetical protein
MKKMKKMAWNQNEENGLKIKMKKMAWKSMTSLRSCPEASFLKGVSSLHTGKVHALLKMAYSA